MVDLSQKESSLVRARVSSISIPLILLGSLLVGMPTASAQENPYAPEVDYLCDDNIVLVVDPSYDDYYYYGYYNVVTCSIINNNVHDVTVKLSEGWAHSVEGPMEISPYGYCEDSTLGDEITVGANSGIDFCYILSADPYTKEGEITFKTTSEVIRYSTVIPCDNCEPVDESVAVSVLPWITVDVQSRATPESAYDYDTTREDCEKTGSSELTLEITPDGNFVSSPETEVRFEYRMEILDLASDERVDYRESTFGSIDMDYDSDLVLVAGETVESTFSASWEITEDTGAYDIWLRTDVGIFTYLDYSWGYDWYDYYIDECPVWEGTLPILESPSEEKASGITVNLSSSFSGSLSLVSILAASIVISMRRAPL